MRKQRVYKHLKTMTVEQYEKYVNEAVNGYIKINHHPEDDNVVILNYTEQTTFARRWNNETMTARGLILDLTEAKDNGIIYILAKPFYKFFNYGENLEYQEDIDFTQTPVVMEKMDGSLGISYFFNDEIRFATRGSFISDQAIEATKIWKEKYADAMEWGAYELSPVTYLVEIIYQSNRIVVDYGGMRDLILLGVMQIFNNGGHSHNDFILDQDYEMIEREAGWLGMNVAPQYELTLDKMLEMKKSISANEEGWILRYGDKRLKIKGDEYLTVHKITYGLSDKAKFEAWASGNLEEFIMKMPEEFRTELEEFGERLDGILGVELMELHNTYREARKMLATYINKEIDKDQRGFVFGAFDFKGINEMEVRKQIAKNYKQYMEVS
ncbi:RNA ligase [Bacillus phage vB_BanS_Nate]|uniref:RNA ligase n=1 Tax=Bacillus phage vB_BanS_Nate TaxID=2894788 RepID=A0AAE8YVC6_9CAUD|nr:RNA ligase [Bacillus phage vB_BanS_Nate]UGO51025.1 RNA ligase [Bacillus phage vB_BanS_Nate]